MAMPILWKGLWTIWGLFETGSNVTRELTSGNSVKAMDIALMKKGMYESFVGAGASPAEMLPKRPFCSKVFTLLLRRVNESIEASSV